MSHSARPLFANPAAAHVARMFGFAAALAVCAVHADSGIGVLRPASEAMLDETGFAIARSGDRVASGAPGVAQGTGAVDTWDCASWPCASRGRTVPADGLPGAQFGAAVALDGNTLAVGATGIGSGAVYVYTDEGAGWVLQARIVPPDGVAGDRYGGALALSGDTLLVGSERADSTRGAAYVMVRTAGLWSLQARLVASDRRQHDFFGHAVALDGDTALVGAPYKKISLEYAAGAAYLFSRSAVTWSTSTRLVGNPPSTGALFGHAVAIRGAHLIVAAPLAAGQSGQILDFASAAATPVLLPLNSISGDRAGWSLGGTSPSLLVGMPFARGGGACGAVQPMSFDGVNWIAGSPWTPRTASIDGLFGWSASGTVLAAAIGTPGDDVAAQRGGAVAIFDGRDVLFSDSLESQAIACP